MNDFCSPISAPTAPPPIPLLPGPAQTRRSSARTSAATGPAVGRPRRGSRADSATGCASQRCGTGPGCGAALPRRKSPFFCLEEKNCHHHTPPVYSTSSDLVEGGAGGREQEEGWLRRGGVGRLINLIYFFSYIDWLAFRRSAAPHGI